MPNSNLACFFPHDRDCSHIHKLKIRQDICTVDGIDTVKITYEYDFGMRSAFNILNVPLIC